MSEPTDGPRHDGPPKPSAPADISGAAGADARTVDLSNWADLDLTGLTLQQVMALLPSCDLTTASVKQSLGVSWACERILRTVAAHQTRALAHAADLVNHEDRHQHRSRNEVDAGTDEISAEINPRYALTKGQAWWRVRTAEQLTRDLPALLDLVHEGRIALSSAALVNRVMRTALEPDTCPWTAVARKITKEAPGQTSRQLERSVRQAIEAIDPIAAQNRYNRAARQRKVVVYPLPDGMGALEATMSADAIQLADEVLDDLADNCRDYFREVGLPEPGTHQQRRADALAALFQSAATGTPLPIIAKPTAPQDESLSDSSELDELDELDSANGPDEPSNSGGPGGPSGPSGPSGPDEPSEPSGPSEPSTPHDPHSLCHLDGLIGPHSPQETTDRHRDDPGPGHSRDSIQDADQSSTKDRCAADQPSATGRPDDPATASPPADSGTPNRRSAPEQRLDEEHDQRTSGIDHVLFGATVLPSDGLATMLDAGTRNALPHVPGCLAWWMPPNLRTRHGRGTHLVLTMAASTLAGDDEQPADLSGYGPIPANFARTIAGKATRTSLLRIPIGDEPCESRPPDPPSPSGSPAEPHGVNGPGVPSRPSATDRPDAPAQTSGSTSNPARTQAPGPTATWSFSDPHDHNPGDLNPCPNQALSYRPDQKLKDKVIGLHQRCTYPGCTARAERCDLDHLRPYADGGSTCACNLHPLCRRHHRLKTCAGWNARFTRTDESRPAGTVAWTTRQGLKHLSPPPIRPGSNGWLPPRPSQPGPTTLPDPGDAASQPDETTPRQRGAERRSLWNRGLSRLPARELLRDTTLDSDGIGSHGDKPNERHGEKPNEKRGKKTATRGLPPVNTGEPPF